MSKAIKIKSKIDFVKNFLSPICKISDSAILELSESKLKCLTCTSDNSIIYYVEFPIETEISNVLFLNCPDIKKLIKALDTVKKSEVIFEIENNNLSYKDASVRFKYHLQEDGIIKKPKLNLEKLNITDFYSHFSLKSDDIKELIRGSVFSTDSNKAYIFSDEEGVYAELTDKTRNNIDTITIKIADSINGESLTQLPLNFEIFRIMDISSIQDIKVKINNKIGLVLFDFENNYNKTMYIMSSLIK
jgi:hypothetical protein